MLFECEMKKAIIAGTGAYLPERILSNKDLEKMVETTDEWIVTRTGMKERRIASESEFASTMGIKAAQKALDKAGITPEELDLILVATITPDYLFPSTAALVQAEIQAFNAACMDFQAACTGFIYGLSMAKSFIESGSYKKILLIATEKLSSIVNYEDRNTCVLFGDGAAAAVLTDEGKGLEVEAVNLGADGELSQLLILPAGGSRHPASIETVQNNQHYISMEGKEVFKHAVRRMESAIQQCLESHQLSQSQLDWLIPHQANERIIDAIAKRFEINRDRVYKTVQKYGNTSASSVPIALNELLETKQVSDGDHVALVSFGAGFTWGAAILKQQD